MQTTKNNYYAVLMAGGVGSRFWPVSKASFPKQFIDILGIGESLLQTTFRRLTQLMPPDHIYILTNKNYIEIIKKQLPDIKAQQIVAEPEMRNTAPSILLGALKIYKKNKEALTIVAPCDHWIEEGDAFLENVKTAFNKVEKEDKLITLGIEPKSPNTGYGYIEYNKEDKNALKKVTKFTEKPTLKKAQKFLDAGNYLWNAGIFIWSAKYIIENFKSHIPEMYRIFEKGSEIWNTSKENEFLEEHYGLAPNISIDYGILEKSENVFVIPADFEWSDLGTWSSLQNELPEDDNKNTIVHSRLHAEDSEGNIIYTEKDKIVVLKGLKDFIVVEDSEVLMIVPKNSEQEIKQLREEVIKNFGEKLG